MSSVEAGPKQCGSCSYFRTEGVDGMPFGAIDAAVGPGPSPVKKLKRGVCGRPYGLVIGIRTEESVCLPPLKHSPIKTEA